MRALILFAIAVQLPIALACGGVMSQAGVQTLTDHRTEVAAMSGDGKQAALDAIDEAMVLAAAGDVGFSELVFLGAALEDAKRDGEISVTEASVIQAKVDELTAP